MTEPSESRQPQDAIVVSIKPTVKHDSALLVFKGPDGPAVQQQIASFFGFTNVAGSPYDTFLDAEQIAKGVSNVQTDLGGVLVASQVEPKGKATPVSPKPAGSPSVPAASEPELTPEQELILKIANAASRRDIASLFAENKELWKNPEVAKAAKMKAEALA